VFFGLLLPWLFVVVGFTVLYGLMVSKQIALRAAMVGGIVGGTLWFGAAHAYGWYAASTVYYANIYGSLAAIPIFVFWLYLCWLVVFIGAQAGFAWQNLDRYREEILSTAPSQVCREQIALRVVAEAARRFVQGEPAPTAAQLAAELGMSARAVNEAMGRLIALGVLTEVGDDQHIVLSHDPRLLSPPDVLHRLRAEGQRVVAREHDALMARIATHYERADDAADAAWKGLSFAELAERDAGANDAGGSRQRVARRQAGD
jgi:membrane protein